MDFPLSTLGREGGVGGGEGEREREKEGESLRSKDWCLFLKEH